MRRATPWSGGLLAASTLFLTGGLYSPQASAVTVTSGFSLSQVNYAWTNDSVPYSSVGELNASLPSLDAASGLSGPGYLNIATSSGWVAQNIVVDGSTPIASNLLLPTSTGTPISTLSATVDFSSAPLLTFGNTSPSTVSVGQSTYSAEGFGSNTIPNGYIPNMPPGTLTFGGGGGSLTLQPGHPNVQAANNQCFPAAVANSLSWLKQTQGLNVPQPNNPGLGNVGGNGLSDGTLVGDLDVDMNRGVTSRAQGNPVGAMAGLQGKLKYLADNNLTNVVVKHQGQLGGGNVSMTSNGNTITSAGQGTTITPNFLQSELAAGEDVEMGFLYYNAAGKVVGGHFVELIGGGTVLGTPFILYQSDHLQSDQDPTDTKGTDQVDFSFLEPGPNGLTLVNEAGQPAAAFVISESVVPEPAVLGLLALGTISLLRHRRHEA